MSESVIVAQATDGSLTLLWLGGLVVLFYFLLIRPQRVRAKRHEQLVSSLSVGDSVQTVGGIYGEILSLDEDSAVIKVEDGGKLRIARRSVGSKRS